MTCSKCGSEYRPDATFCGYCGAPTGVSTNGVPVSDPTATNGASPLTQTSDATRYLCAAVQLDSVLAERVIREIVDEEFRAPPWSPGVDLGLVLRHALAARGRQFGRDVAVAALALAFVYFVLRLSVSACLVVLLLAWLVLVFERCVATYGVVARELGPARSGGALRAPRLSRQHEERLDQIAAGGGNVTVYGAYSPFVGSGVPVDAWSVALTIDRPAEGRTVEEFTVHEIHDHTLARLRKLQLPDTVVDDRLVVDGRDVLDDRRFLVTQLAPPIGHVDEPLLRA